MRQRLRRSTPALLLAAAALLLFRHALFSRWRGIPWDLRGYHLPLAAFFADSVRDGRLPLWDPYTYCGFPFFANIQAQVFYPPAWIVMLLANTGGRMVDWLEWEVVAHVILAGLFTYALLRRLGCGPASAVLGGMAFELGGFFASQAQHVGAIASAAWIPAAWLAIFHLRDDITSRRIALLAGALAMSFLAGFPQVFFVAVYSCGVLALALVLLRRARPGLLLAAVLAGLWCALLAAVQLAPTLQATRLSLAPMRGEWFDSPGGVPWQGLVSMVWPNRFHIFEPDRYSLPWNYTFLYLYSSIAGLLFALAALLLRRARECVPIAVAGLACGLWMMGEHTPVWTTVHRLLPTAVRSPLYAEFAMAGFLLAVALLAGLGAEWVLGRRRPWLRWAAVVLAAADLIHAGAGRPMNTTQSRGQDPLATAAEFESSRRTLAGMRRLTGAFTPPARFEIAGDTVNWAAGAPAMRLFCANGNDPLALRRIVEVERLYSKHELWNRWAPVSDPASPVLGLLNVRYLVAWEGPPAAAVAGLPLAARLPGHHVYENPRALPRFFLVHRARPAADLPQVLAILGSPQFDPSREAVVEGPLPAGLAGGGMQPVRVVEYSPHRVRLSTGDAAPALLVTSETWYPGWHATVDGREQPLLMVNGAFRGLALPPGAHDVRMWFSPAILWWSMAVSMLAWAGLTVVIFRREIPPRT